MGTRSKERIIRTIPPTSTIRATVSVPGSKSITQRVVVAAALARGTSRLVNPLESEDTRLLRDALISVGIPILREGSCWTVEGRGGKISPASGELYLGNNGTASGFLPPLLPWAAAGTSLQGPGVWQKGPWNLSCSPSRLGKQRQGARREPAARRSKSWPAVSPEGRHSFPPRRAASFFRRCSL
jgi:hypothetical protein